MVKNSYLLLDLLSNWTQQLQVLVLVPCPSERWELGLYLVQVDVAHRRDHPLPLTLRTLNMHLQPCAHTLALGLDLFKKSVN